MQNYTKTAENDTCFEKKSLQMSLYMQILSEKNIIERVHKEWVTLFQVGNPFSAHIYIICKMYAQ